MDTVEKARAVDADSDAWLSVRWHVSVPAEPIWGAEVEREMPAREGNAEATSQGDEAAATCVSDTKGSGGGRRGGS